MPGDQENWLIQLGVSPVCFEVGTEAPELEAPVQAGNYGSNEAPGQPAIAADAGSAPSGELSGSAWVSKFPASTSLDDLKDPFKTNCKDFVAALEAAGATVSISTTYRPDERAFLMHYAYQVAKGTIAASDVPAKAGININWVHPTDAASKKAAQEMVDGYGIVYAPTYPSNHSGKTAVDMDISWSGPLKIKNKDGTEAEIKSGAQDGTNTELHKVGATYSVIKLVSDKPHWSATGT